MERQIHLIIKHSKTLGIKKKEKRMKFSLSFRIFQFIPQPHLKLAGNPSMNLLSSLFDWVLAVKLLDKAGLAGLGLPALNWSSWLRPGRSQHHWSGQPAREHDGAAIPEVKRQFLQRDATSFVFYLINFNDLMLIILLFLKPWRPSLWGQGPVRSLLFYSAFAGLNRKHWTGFLYSTNWNI